MDNQLTETMSSEKLIGIAYDRYDGTDEMMPPYCPVVFVHGVLDSKRNWADIAETIADRTVRMVYSIDLPSHGDSVETDPLSPTDFIENIEKFLNKIGEPVIYVGHSLGAVPGMEIALRKPNMIKKLVLIDMAPVSYPLSTAIQIREVINVMRDALKIIPPGSNFVETKRRVDSFLKRALPRDAIRKMILPTLAQNNNEVKWKTNLDVVEKGSINTSLHQLFPFDGSYDGKTLIIVGELSNYVRGQDYEKIRKIFPNVKIQCMKNSNHWIHIEKKEDLINDLLAFLSQH